MPSPLKLPHGRKHGRVCHWLYKYEDATPGTMAVDNATTILDSEAEPQPDGSLLRITAPGHGQTKEEDEYIVGAPELGTAEVAASSVAIDLHRKREPTTNEPA